MSESYLEVGGFGNADVDDPHGDRETLHQLAAAGADMAVVTTFVHYLTFDAEARMVAAGRAIRQSLGYSVEGFPPEGSDDGWSLRVTIERLPSLESVQRMREVMEVAARRFDGSYDGWEAAVREG
ncbi:ribonuclease E inhibitor RraB [Micromonospora sp. 067-2]|uniref:ribonuclease E inhibitor RraB n=1 Tax=Micromonospora sp. 067-2 TaxID=2789270 RepID=UPI003979C631